MRYSLTAMGALTLAVLVAPLSFGAAAAQAAPVRDVGIFSDLDAAVVVTVPRHVDKRRTRLSLDDAHGLLVLFEGGVPLKAYALSRPAPPGPLSPLALLAQLDGPGATELRALIDAATPVQRVAVSTAPAPGDQDGDGIPDQLDVLMGARKLVLNRAAYTEGYYKLSFPGGDVPRDVGVCSDTIVRAYRNAGIDLQRRVADDIQSAPAAYAGVTRPNTSIDHRRVKTLLTWFLRHVPQVHGEPPRPGDVVFLDTFPRRAGPDHVGIISDRIAPSGLPYVINNWTVGFREGEMDLLPTVPVTHLFRLK
jgi:uncharacterized protein YijF (DUF1287 family)